VALIVKLCPWVNSALDREGYRKDFGFQIKLLNFVGTLQADEIINWLKKVKWIFKCKKILEHIRVKLVMIQLKGWASVW
jgi:hypothetical protein